MPSHQITTSIAGKNTVPIYQRIYDDSAHMQSWRMLLEMFLPGEASEHQQSPNTPGTEQWVWNVLPVPDNS